MQRSLLPIATLPNQDSVETYFFPHPDPPDPPYIGKSMIYFFRDGDVHLGIICIPERMLYKIRPSPVLYPYGKMYNNKIKLQEGNFQCNGRFFFIFIFCNNKNTATHYRERWWAFPSVFMSKQESHLVGLLSFGFLH